MTKVGVAPLARRLDESEPAQVTANLTLFPWHSGTSYPSHVQRPRMNDARPLLLRSPSNYLRTAECGRVEGTRRRERGDVHGPTMQSASGLGGAGNDLGSVRRAVAAARAGGGRGRPAEADRPATGRRPGDAERHPGSAAQRLP